MSQEQTTTQLLETIEKRLPSNLLEIHARHRQRIRLRKRRSDDLYRQHQEEVNELNEEVLRRKDDLLEFLADEYVRTGRDPEQTPRHERAPEDVLREAQLAKAMNQAAIKRNDRGREIDEKVDQSEEYHKHRQADEDFQQFLDRVGAHFGAPPADFDWDRGVVKVYTGDEQVPDHLLEFPED